MKVLSVQHYPVFGGPHNEILQLEPELNRLGIETIVALTDDAGNAAARLEGHVQVCKLPLRRLRRSFNPRRHLETAAAMRENVAQLRALIAEHDIDIVKVHGPHNPIGAVAARGTRAAVTWVVSSTRVPGPFRRLGAQIVTRMADSVLVTGHRVIDAYPGLSRARDRTVVYYPPVNTTTYRPRPELRDEARAELGLSADDLVIGCVGNINPQKGIEQLVEAYATVHRAEPSARLVLVGAEYATHREYSQAVRRRIRHHGLVEGRDVVFAGERSDVERVLPAFDVFALASVPDSEGVPTVILEAMACGLPVVATDVGAVREVVELGATGVITPPLDTATMADDLTELLRDPLSRASMGREARRRAVLLYDVAVCARTHLRAYETALAHRNSQHAGVAAVSPAGTTQPYRTPK